MSPQCVLGYTKKVFVTAILWLFLFAGTADAKMTQFTKGKIYEGEVNWRHKMIYNLPPGKWQVVDKWHWSVNAITARGATLEKLNGNVLDEIIEFEEVNINGKWMSYLVLWLQEIFFKNEHDGCYQRPEYYLTKVKKKGSFFNCLIVRHQDTEKLLFSPDDKSRKTATAVIRKHLRDSNIEVPKIMISRYHGFFAPSVKDSYYGIFYLFNPETHGGPKNKYLTEVTSEYHRSNINNYPKFKKYMDDFLNVAAYEHTKFEEVVRAKSQHLLDLSQFDIDIEEPIKESKTTSSNLTNELKELNELYKSGALTKEEYTKAKKKLLN